jgi:hypothetical protein
MPSRYEPARRGLAGLGGTLRRTVTHGLVQHGPRIVERLIFGPLPLWPSALVRGVLQRLRRKHLAEIGAAFDRGFYLGQMPDTGRSRAARAPLLHYATVGCLDRRAPTPELDVAFYRRNVPNLPLLADPLRHWRTDGRKQGLARNRAEAACASSAGGMRPGDAPSSSGQQGTVLIFHHARGGGSEMFLDRFEADLHRQGHRILRLRAVAGAPTLAVHDGAVAEVLDLSCERGLLAFARRHGVQRLVVNHLIDRPPAMHDWIGTLAAALGCGYDVILHDYFALCPRVHLITGEGRFCDGAAPAACGRCVAAWGTEVADIVPLDWRSKQLAFLAGAGRLIAPSADLARRMQRFLPDRSIDVWSPEFDDGLPHERSPRLKPGEPLKVATLGALNVPKGLRVLRALARQARQCDAPIAFTVLGPCAEARALRRLGVRVSGPYREPQLDALIDSAGPHLVFQPAIWPETWSFVLTSALRHALPVAVFDIGAPAERLRRLQRGHVLPLDLSNQPASLLAALLALRRQWLVPA